MLHPQLGWIKVATVLVATLSVALGTLPPVEAAQEKYRRIPTKSGLHMYAPISKVNFVVEGLSGRWAFIAEAIAVNDDDIKDVLAAYKTDTIVAKLVQSSGNDHLITVWMPLGSHRKVLGTIRVGYWTAGWAESKSLRALAQEKRVRLARELRLKSEAAEAARLKALKKARATAAALAAEAERKAVTLQQTAALQRIVKLMEPRGYILDERHHPDIAADKIELERYESWREVPGKLALAFRHPIQPQGVYTLVILSHEVSAREYVLTKAPQIRGICVILDEQAIPHWGRSRIHVLERASDLAGISPVSTAQVEVALSRSGISTTGLFDGTHDVDFQAKRDHEKKLNSLVRSNAITLRMAVETFAVDSGGIYPTIDQILSIQFKQRYLRDPQIPINPWSRVPQDSFPAIERWKQLTDADASGPITRVGRVLGESNQGHNGDLDTRTLGVLVYHVSESRNEYVLYGIGAFKGDAIVVESLTNKY